jgi:hypothetical protein
MNVTNNPTNLLNVPRAYIYAPPLLSDLYARAILANAQAQIPAMIPSII